LLFLIEHFSSTLWQKYIAFVPDWLIHIHSLLPKPNYPDDRDAVVELISVIASISGVILALFYPILATIASTAYAKVHASIRNLLLYEKETQSYLHGLTFLTACSITVLLFLSFHILPGNLVLSFLVTYSLTIIFGILKIGLGVYNFFEPSTLARIVSVKLADAINNVTTDGEFWYEKNFQNYNFKIAFEQTENLSLITNLCLKDNDIKESSFKLSIQTSFVALQYYLHQKPKIPIDSLWYPNIYSHLSYFESDITLRGLSKNTNTFVQPKIIQNNYWFEERVISSISNGLDSVVKNGHFNVLADTILLTYQVFDSLSSSMDLKTGELILSKLLKNIIAISDKKDKETNVLNYDDWKHELSSIEAYCNGILRFQLGILDRITQFNSAKILAEYTKINWVKKNSIYSTDFIPDLYDLLNKFCQYVKNEKDVEGNRLTPDWYFRQALTAEFLRIITIKITDAINLFETYLISAANLFYEVNNPLLSSFASHIGLEIINKIQYRIRELKRTLIDIDHIEVCKDEFKWVKPNFEKISDQIENYKQQCLSLVVKNIDKLSLVK
jgi:hypothetical protein